MRIYSNKFYVLASVPGISGMKRWSECEYHIVTGQVARDYRFDVLGEWTPQEDEKYALDDGHLPEYQPQEDPLGVRHWLRDNPYGAARAVGRAHDRLNARYDRVAEVGELI